MPGFISPISSPSLRNLELGGQRVSCWASLERHVAKYACDSVRVISWAQPKPMLPLASSRQLAARASLEVLQPFGIHGTPPPLGPELLSLRFSSANPTGHPGGLLAPDVQSVWAAAPLPLPPHLTLSPPLSPASLHLPLHISSRPWRCYRLPLPLWGGGVGQCCDHHVQKARLVQPSALVGSSHWATQPHCWGYWCLERG